MRRRIKRDSMVKPGKTNPKTRSKKGSKRRGNFKNSTRLIPRKKRKV